MDVAKYNFVLFCKNLTVFSALSCFVLTFLIDFARCFNIKPLSILHLIFMIYVLLSISVPEKEIDTVIYHYSGISLPIKETDMIRNLRENEKGF